MKEPSRAAIITARAAIIVACITGLFGCIGATFAAIIGLGLPFVQKLVSEPTPVVAVATATATQSVADVITPDTPTSAPISPANTSTPELPTSTLTPTPALINATVRVEALNLRTGPGVGYVIIGKLTQGDIIIVIAQNRGGDWLKVDDEGKTGWVAKEYVEVPEGVAMVPTAEVPPTETPTSTPSSEPTATPTPTQTPSPTLPPTPIPTHTSTARPTFTPTAPSTSTPIPSPTPTPIPCPSIEPAETVQCPTTGDCIFDVRGCFPNVAIDVQTVVIFVDPGGGNWWPQNLDFPVDMINGGEWKGKAKIGVGPQPSETKFRIIALLMKRTEVPTTMQAYQELPPSDNAFGPIPLVVE